MTQYKLDLSPEQKNILSNALDYYIQIKTVDFASIDLSLLPDDVDPGRIYIKNQLIDIAKLIPEESKNRFNGLTVEEFKQMISEILKTDSIILTPKQSNIFRNALELYSRFGIGQTYTIGEEFIFTMETELYHLICDKLRTISSYYSICSDKVSKCYKMAWEMQQVLRFAQSWHENPKGGITVDFDKPFNCSGEKLPICTILN